MSDRILKPIEYIGRHTLEIYLLHYFFLPKNLRYLSFLISPDGQKDTNIILELIICSFMAFLVVIISLHFARIIKRSKILKLLYLGQIK